MPDEKQIMTIADSKLQRNVGMAPISEYSVC